MENRESSALCQNACTSLFGKYKGIFSDRSGARFMHSGYWIYTDPRAEQFWGADKENNNQKEIGKIRNCRQREKKRDELKSVPFT